MKPIPTSDKALNAAKDAMKTLDAIMRPATRDQVGMEFKKLYLISGKQTRTPEEMKYMFNSYYTDLKEYPIKLIAEACEEYRKLPDGNSFMPQSGLLIELMSVKWSKMKFMRLRINKILGTHVDKPLKQNKTVSLAEALSQFD